MVSLIVTDLSIIVVTCFRDHKHELKRSIFLFSVLITVDHYSVLMEIEAASKRSKRSNAGAGMNEILEQLNGLKAQQARKRKLRLIARLQRDDDRGQQRIEQRKVAQKEAQQTTRARAKATDPIKSRLTKVANARQHRKLRKERAVQEARVLEHDRERLQTIQYGRPTKEMLSMYESDPQAALMFLADSTGFDTHHDQFNESTNEAFDGSQSGMKHLDPVPDSVKIRCVSAYEAVMNPNIPFAVCGSCGRRDIGEKHTIYDLQQVTSLHLHESSPRAQKFRHLPHELQRYMNIYELEDGQLINVHPELVQTDQDTHAKVVSVCGSCSSDLLDNKIPRFNVGNGYDFGRLPDLELTLAETMVTACCLRYQAIVKFVGKFPTPTQFGVTGHVLVFAHDGKDAIAKTLPRLDMSGHLNVAFIGAKQAWSTSTGSEASRKRFYRQNPSVTISAAKVFRWLYLKKALDPAFKDIDIVDNHETRRILEGIPDQIISNALVTEDEHVLAKEAMVNDNVAHIRTGAGATSDAGTSDTNDVSSSETVVGPVTAANAGAAECDEATMPYAFIFPEVTANTVTGPQILQTLQNQLTGDNGAGANIVSMHMRLFNLD